jgi:aryl-alcohol dehydrogenase-like predicted oxidoreductase
LLTATITKTEDLADGDFRKTDRHPRFQGDNFKHNLELVELLKLIASEKSITPAQLALAWLLHQGPDIVPIPGTKHRTRLEENCAAADIELTKEELERIDAVARPGAFAGQRYADMSTVNA